jgi:hypothetical protein
MRKPSLEFWIVLIAAALALAMVLSLATVH